MRGTTQRRHLLSRDSNIPPNVATKDVSRHCQMSPGGKSPLGHTCQCSLLSAVPERSPGGRVGERDKTLKTGQWQEATCQRSWDSVLESLYLVPVLPCPHLPASLQVHPLPSAPPIGQILLWEPALPLRAACLLWPGLCFLVCHRVGA